MINYLNKIYIINLTEDKNKYETVIKNISLSPLLNNQYERFNAVNGKYIDIRLLNDNILTDKAKEDIEFKKQKIYGISLTYGSLGCALSHYLLYKQILQHNKPSIIFEDDIILVDNFNQKIMVLMDHIQNLIYDICYLGYNIIPGFYKEDVNSVIAKPSGLITGLYAYIVTPQGAKKLLDNIFPLNHQIDSSISRNQDKLSLVCSTELLVKVRTNFISKTQKSASCENYCQTESISDWNKLFKK